MNERVFIDTNVLVYARDAQASDKRAVAAEWLRRLGVTGRGCVNLQVLNEFVGVILRRQPRRPLEDIREEVDQFAVWGQRPLHMQDIRIAWTVREALGFQWFDCLLLASASNDGCNVFLSEDMTDGARFGDLVIVNPFLHHPDEFLTSD